MTDVSRERGSAGRPARRRRSQGEADRGFSFGMEAFPNGSSPPQKRFPEEVQEDQGRGNYPALVDAPVIAAALSRDAPTHSVVLGPALLLR